MSSHQPILSKLLAGLILVLFTQGAWARQLEGVDFPEEKDLAGQKLVLNGTGLRTKRKLGMTWRVYVAGLYLENKQTSSQAVLSSESTKVLDIVFLRSIDKETLQEAWRDGFEKNCASDCQPAKAAFNSFNELMADVADKSRLRLSFEKDSVHIELDGKQKKSATVTGQAFRRALLAIFLGDQPPTTELRAGLLGAGGAS